MLDFLEFKVWRAIFVLLPSVEITITSSATPRCQMLCRSEALYFTLIGHVIGSVKLELEESSLT